MAKHSEVAALINAAATEFGRLDVVIANAGYSFRPDSPLDKSLKLLADRSRLAYIPLDRYELDMDLARGAPRDVCQRWCVLPFDRMSKSVLVATCNPFNKQAATDLAGTIRTGCSGA